MRVFTDRVAVVTGAGSGIGRGLALELASRGCHLALTDRDGERLAEVAAEVRATGRTVTEHVFDVSDRAAWGPFVEAVLAAHGGRVHLVVNNAGVSLTGTFAAYGLDELDWQLGVNLFGVIYGCHAFLPVLKQQDEAHLVNLSSIFGIISMPEHAGYCMAKHAVRALSESLAVELQDTRVRVTSVHPGAVATRIAADGRMGREAKVDREKAKALIGRGMPPERAARIIVDAVARDRRRVLVGTDAKVLAFLQRLLPVRYLSLVGMWYRRS